MKIDYDKVADIIYFTVKTAPVAKSIEVDDRMIVDVAANGEIVGIELLDASSEQGRELERNIKEGVPVNIVSATPVAA